LGLGTPLVLLKFRGTVERREATFRFEVDRGYSPLAPRSIVELKGEDIYAIYRTKDGVYVVCSVEDPDRFRFYLAEGVPEGAELLGRETYKYYACPVPGCGGRVEVDLDSGVVWCPVHGRMEWWGDRNGPRVVEAVAYEPRPFDWGQVVRGRPPRTVEELRGTRDLRRSLTAENADTVLLQLAREAGIGLGWARVLKEWEYVTGLWRKAVDLRGALLSLVEGAVVGKALEPPDVIVEYGVFLCLEGLGSGVRAAAKVSSEVTPEGYAHLAKAVERGELRADPQVLGGLSGSGGGAQVQELVDRVSRALAELEEKWRAPGETGEEAGRERERSPPEEARERVERTREELARLKIPDWADGLYFAPGARGTVTAYPVKRSKYGEGFYFSPSWRPAAEFSPIVHDMSLVPVGVVVTREGEVVRVKPYTPKSSSKYTSLAPEEPGAEGQGEEVGTARAKKETVHS